MPPGPLVNAEGFRIADLPPLRLQRRVPGRFRGNVGSTHKFSASNRRIQATITSGIVRLSNCAALRPAAADECHTGSTAEIAKPVVDGDGLRSCPPGERRTVDLHSEDTTLGLRLQAENCGPVQANTWRA